MSLNSVANQFAEMYNQFKNFDVMRSMYSSDIVSVEGDGTEIRGQEPVIHKSEIFVSPSQFAAYFVFDITRKAPRKRETVEELGLYTVNKDDKIAREQFISGESWPRD